MPQLAGALGKPVWIMSPHGELAMNRIGPIAVPDWFSVVMERNERPQGGVRGSQTRQPWQGGGGNYFDFGRAPFRSSSSVCFVNTSIT